MGALPSKPDCSDLYGTLHSLLTLRTLHGHRLNQIRIELSVCRPLWLSFHWESSQNIGGSMMAWIKVNMSWLMVSIWSRVQQEPWSHRSFCDLSKPVEVTRGVSIICQILSLSSPTLSVKIIHCSVSQVWVMRFWNVQLWYTSFLNTEMLCIINKLQSLFQCLKKLSLKQNKKKIHLSSSNPSPVGKQSTERERERNRE